MILAALGARRKGSVGVPYPLPTARPYNAPIKAITPTYEGTGEAVHPSVVDMNRYGGPWHGWRYWMSMTPFANGDAGTENPSILVSNDGYHWQVPSGLTNPVYPTPWGGYHSDTHLIYDPAGDRLLMLYRWSPPGGDSQIFLAASNDGVTWPSYGTQLSIPFNHSSPSLLRVGDEWQIICGSGAQEQKLWKSTDLVTWTGGEVLIGPPAVDSVWHLAVQYFDGQYWMVLDRGPGHLLNRPDGYRAATSLDGIVWTIAPDDFMSPIGLDYETRQHYRADIQPHEDGIHVRLWYSHQATTSDPSVYVWGTSYTQVRRDEWPVPITAAGALALDRFNRADGALGAADTGQAWTVVGNPYILGTRATLGASGTRAVLDVGQLDQKVTVRTDRVDVYSGVIIRSDATATNYYRITIWATNWIIVRRIGGSEVVLDQWPMESANNYTIGGSVTTGASSVNITAYRNGVAVRAYSDTSADRLTSGTYAGIHGNTGAVFDDFVVTAP